MWSPRARVVRLYRPIGHHYGIYELHATKRKHPREAKSNHTHDGSQEYTGNGSKSINYSGRPAHPRPSNARHAPFLRFAYPSSRSMCCLPRRIPDPQLNAAHVPASPCPLQPSQLLRSG
ncbi:hypothetical protein VTH06DRAFT_964 [Thermothelomyces fergusii]